MNTINLDGLYAVYDSANDDVWRFSNEGEVQLFGHYMEAEERCDEHQMPIRCTELSPAWRQIIIKQIESINQRTF
jgi:hypothetical protein